MNHWRILVVTLAVGACTPPDDSARTGETTTRDSAGVTIVESATPAGIAWWRIDSVPDVSIGDPEVADTAAEFGSIGGTSTLPDGRVVVLDGRGESAYEFRVFDSAGKHIVTHGRHGQGPGEYQWVNFFGPDGGDTITAVDFPSRRLNWLSVSKGFLRSVQLDEAELNKVVGGDAYGLVESMTPLGDSLYAIAAFRRAADGASIRDRSRSFHIVDLTTKTAHNLTTLDEPRAKSVVIGGRPTSVYPVQAGEPAFVVDRTRQRICAMITRVTQIQCIDSRGKRLTIRWRTDSVPFTKADRDATEAQYRSNLVKYGRFKGADVDAFVGAVEWPNTHAPISVLQNDPDGNFWILEPYLTASGERKDRYRVLSPDGVHLAFADPFPARSVGLMDETHIGSRVIVRPVETPDGGQTVGIFRIRKDQ